MPQQFSLPLGLDMVPLTKSAEPAEIIQDLYRLYNASKLLAEGLDAYTGIAGAPAADWATVGSGAIMVQNMCRLYLQAAVTITTGQLLAINGSGQLVLGGPGTVIGWAPAAIASGNYGECRLLGLHTAISGLTPGTMYYASATPGGITAVVTAQKVGFAITATRLFFNPA